MAFVPAYIRKYVTGGTYLSTEPRLPSPLRFRFISHRALSLAPTDSAVGLPGAERKERRGGQAGRNHEQRSAWRSKIRRRERRVTGRRRPRQIEPSPAVAGTTGTDRRPPRSSNDRETIEGPSNDARHLSFRRTSCVHQILQLLRALLRTYFAPVSRFRCSPLFALSSRLELITHFHRIPRFNRVSRWESIGGRPRNAR